MLTVSDCLFGNSSGIFAVPALIQLDTTSRIAFCKLAKVAHVHPELLYSARPEGVARSDKHLQHIQRS